MIVLLDTGILIDIALDREPHVGESAALLDELQRGRASAFVAWHSISNFHYLVSPHRGRASIRSFLAELSAFVGVAPTSTESLKFACHLDLPDFEDAMQVAAARACRADVIATRNLRHYKRSPIPAALPRDVLGRL